MQQGFAHQEMLHTNVQYMLVQDAARPVVLSLLLQKALQLSSAGMDSVSAQPFAKREDSWPVVLANSVCHQVSLLLCHAICSKLPAM